MPTWPRLLRFLVTIFSDSLHDLNASCTCIHGPARPHNFQNVFTRGTREWSSSDGSPWIDDFSSMEKTVRKVNLITRPLGSRRGPGIGKISRHEEALMSEELTLVIAGEANNHLDDAVSKRKHRTYTYIAKKRGNDEWKIITVIFQESIGSRW